MRDGQGQRMVSWLMVGVPLFAGCERPTPTTPDTIPNTQPPTVESGPSPTTVPTESTAPEALPPTSTRPSEATTLPALPPSASQPGSPTETQTKPSSFYESRPPYPVKLHLLSTRDEQPGWLRILEFDDAAQPAIATGVFPEKNRIIVQTSNVKQLRIHVGSLPLVANRRVILHIDEQPMELTRQSREVITLERSSIGQWAAVRK